MEQGRPFEREERYIVIKRKHLTRFAESSIRNQLAALEIQPINGAVIEADWPEYEAVWQMIESRVTGARATDPAKPEQGGRVAFTATVGLRRQEKRINSIGELLRLINGGAALANVRLSPPAPSSLAEQGHAFCNKCGFCGTPDENGFHKRTRDGVMCNYTATPSAAPDLAAHNAALVEAGEWRDIETEALRKGLRLTPKYFPAIGETCRVSGPNCDNAEAYTWLEQEVLWRDDLFVVTRTPGCWPTITKLELALFEPLAKQGAA